ncbi:unnamed protein product [Oikopleura dioica]|uniref:alpha-1,2-Mannosidase n=1 Tax=Oikopleura dioica TaxID=34765 RepID=E4YGW4_OIKDI|nr:unnamed protein product [Oikopleura dioica]
MNKFQPMVGGELDPEIKKRIEAAQAELSMEAPEEIIKSSRDEMVDEGIEEDETTTTTSTTTTTTSQTTKKEDTTTAENEETTTTEKDETTTMENEDNEKELENVEYENEKVDEKTTSTTTEEPTTTTESTDNESEPEKVSEESRNEDSEERIEETEETTSSTTTTTTTNANEAENEDIAERKELIEKTVETTTSTTSTSTSKTAISPANNQSKSIEEKEESSDTKDDEVEKTIEKSEPETKTHQENPPQSIEALKNPGELTLGNNAKKVISPKKEEESIAAKQKAAKDLAELMKRKAMAGHAQFGSHNVNNFQAIMPEPRTINPVNRYEPYDFRKGTPGEADIFEKRGKVKEMTLHAWNGYKLNSFGESEVNPLTGQPVNSELFGKAHTGLTIIDALGTLYLMGLEEQFLEAREWIENDFKFDAEAIPAIVSFFESNIRHLGGLLSIYQLTGDQLFLEKAEMVGQVLEKAFKGEKGMPYGRLDLPNGSGMSQGWVPGGCFVLAEIGTISMEWVTLGMETGDLHYKELAETVQNFTREHVGESGIYSNFVRPTEEGLEGCSSAISFAGCADSYYEYILKFYLLGGRKDDLQLSWLEKTVKGVEEHLVLEQKDKEKYQIMMVEGQQRRNPKTGSFDFSKGNRMGHLACFAGGFWGMTSQVLTDKSERFMELAKGVTQSCRDSYVDSPTNLGPETFSNTGASNPGNDYYILRPETVESYFYLWRLTKDEKYREWAWDVVQALEKHCRTEFGFAGLKSVKTGQKNEIQESFLLAETLKYLFLIFSDDELISLDEFVFNTEAHPLRINPSIHQ